MQHLSTRRRLLAFTLLALTLLTSALSALAQDTTGRWGRPNVIKTNLLAPVSVFYERAITHRFALRLSARALKLLRGTFSEQSFINATVEGKFYTARLTNGYLTMDFRAGISLGYAF